MTNIKTEKTQPVKENVIRKHKPLGKGDRVFYTVATIIVLLLTLIILLPMINVVSASFSSSASVNAGKVVLFPVEPTLRNYQTILGYKSVWVGYRNTILYTVVGTFLNVVLTLMCAYPLSQRRFSGRKFFSILFFVPMIFSGGMIPDYILMRDLRLLNTPWAMIIPGAISIYNMIVTRTFIQNSIPESLAEAARIDGCSPARYFFDFVLPLSKAIIAVIAMYYAVAHWNDYFNAFIYLNKRDLYPLQLFLREILVNSQFDASVMTDPEAARQMQGLAQTLKYVVIVVATLPLMCIYPFVQKYFVKGVMIGSIKE